MIFHENRLLADDSHEISYLIFFENKGKMSQILSSAAVVIGALRVKCILALSCHSWLKWSDWSSAVPNFLHAGKFFIFCRLLNIFKINFFKKFSGTLSGCQMVCIQIIQIRTDLVPNCLESLSADNKKCQFLRATYLGTLG